MNNLATKNQEDYTIRLDGTAFTTQRKAAEMCGVSQNAISKFWLSRQVDVKQGLSSDNLSLVVSYYARKGRPEAVSMLVKFAEAGAQAYIYTEAGYTITVSHQDTAAALPVPVDYERIASMIATAITEALANLSFPAIAVPLEPVVERAALPFRPLAVGFLPWREARALYLPGHSEAVFHQVMAVGQVTKRVFDVQFSDMQVNRDCASYQENQIAFACNMFTAQSRRYLRKDGTPTENKWVNPSLGQSYYIYAGDYDPLSFL